MSFNVSKRLLQVNKTLALSAGHVIGSLSNHDGNAKKNVTLKMTSKYFKLVRDSFNSFNLSNVAEQSGRWLSEDGVTV